MNIYDMCYPESEPDNLMLISDLQERESLPLILNDNVKGMEYVYPKSQAFKYYKIINRFSSYSRYGIEEGWYKSSALTVRECMEYTSVRYCPGCGRVNQETTRISTEFYSGGVFSRPGGSRPTVSFEIDREFRADGRDEFIYIDVSEHCLPCVNVIIVLVKRILTVNKVMEKTRELTKVITCKRKQERLERQHNLEMCYAIR